jgi:arylsulfatase A-like enzyme
VREIFGRAVAVGLAVGATWLVVRSRDSGASSTPHAAAAASPKTPVDSTDRGVALRLVDLLSDATYVSPKLPDGFATLRKHWRRMKAPYVGPRGALGKTVQHVALTVSTGEVPLSVDVGGGRRWAPDAQTWNMSEGSYSQREAIFAPAPTTIRYRLAIPDGATLETAVALAAGTLAPVTFEVAASDPREGRKVLATRKLSPHEPPKWNEMSVDLAAYGGRTIDLELVTTAPPGTVEVPAALWGSPVVLAPGASDVPFNVLWIVVDATRPDAIASLHDDTRDELMAHAPVPPLDAWLPKMPAIAPNLDALAKRGVAFTRAWSGAAWTRPGTVAMLAGMRSSELGLDTTQWILPQSDISRFYASRPPMLPILLRPHGVVTRAFVNNYFMIGYARAGVETGFEGIDDHRYATRDTDEIARGTIAWLEKHAGERFALFCNFNSPHSPYLPPPDMLARVPPAPDAPKDPRIRKYLAEIAKDDAAIGTILAKLDELHLRERTIVVMTADHAETLSEAHDDTVPGIDDHPMSQRFHHASSIWDETTRVPLIVSLPGTLPEGAKITVPVQSTDILPTILDLEHVAKDPRITGRSLVPIARDPNGAEARREVPIVVEGRGTRAILVGKWRYVERDPIAETVIVPGKGPVHWKQELYDLERDPGERENVADSEPDVVRSMREKLAAAMVHAKTAAAAASDALAGSTHVLAASSSRPKVHLRFVGAGKAHRITGTITVAKDEGGIVPKLGATPIGIPPESLREADGKLEIALSTVPGAVVGIDLDVDPPTARLAWQLYLDDHPFPTDRAYGGPFGLASKDLADGLVTELARQVATATVSPTIDPFRELGMFVTRDHVGDELEFDRATGDEADHEIDDMLRQWGYAHDATQSAPR